MVKDFIPCDIKNLSGLIEEYRKIKKIPEEEEKEVLLKLLHNNFCRYLFTKGNNKGTLCLNKFKDTNELKYCHTHRWEMKPWMDCKSNGCNGKSKKDYCRKCKKIINTPLPEITNDEIIELSNEYIHYEIIKTVIPNAKYRIINYHLHNYYKKHSITIINLIFPKYVNGKKIKTIKDNEYLTFLNLNKIEYKKILKTDIQEYNKYINDKICKFSSFIRILVKLKKIRKKYISLETVCNIPLPPPSKDEEILLSLNINDLYEKKIVKNKFTNDETSELNISENKVDENDKKFESFCNMFKNKCMNCYSYKRLIIDLCTINIKIYDILSETFNEVNSNNLIKMNEIFDILKKPKLKPIHVNKIYNDFPKMINYGEKINKIIKEDFKNLCKTYYIIYNDIEKAIKDDIIATNFIEYF